MTHYIRRSRLERLQSCQTCPIPQSISVRANVLRAVAISVALLACTRIPANAQRPVEMGIDAMFAIHSFGGERLLEVSGPMGGMLALGPLQAFRVGFFMNDRVSLEPSVGLNILAEENSDALTRFGFSANVLYHFGSVPSRGTFAGIGGNSMLIKSGDAASQFGVHALIGQNLALASRVNLRLAAGASHAFENDDFDSRQTYFVTLGVSYLLGGTGIPLIENTP